MTKDARLPRNYLVALEKYLSQPDEDLLLTAYELGRAALSDGLSILEFATVHSRALSSLLKYPLTEDERSRLLDRHTDFFVEALSAFEMTHRGFRDANTVLRRLNDILEGQAKRIAYTLHDEASQLLASVHLALAEATREFPREQVEVFTKVKDLLNEIEDRLRTLSHELRPPMLEYLGLPPALEILAEGVSKRWGLPVTVNSSLTTDVPATVGITVYRITQEALTNVAKHAEASRAEIDLRQVEQTLVCSVRDDGIGIAPNYRRSGHPGLGLVEISERVTALGGVMRLGRNQNRGTDLTIEIPLEIERMG
jgi:signal transduction histidine kinase